jgi:hypothetical protein
MDGADWPLTLSVEENLKTFAAVFSRVEINT